MSVELFEQWRATGREVAVVGLGKSGTAATKLLRHEGLPVYASDTGKGPAYERWAQELTALGAAVQVGGHEPALRIASRRVARACGGLRPAA